MSYLFLPLILIFSFLIQVFPRFRIQHFGVDTWRWLLYAREIRNHRGIPRYIDKYLVKARYSYPPLFHIILSLFPQKILEKYNAFFSPFFSLIENLVLFFSILYFDGTPTQTVLASLIYSCTAANIIENNNLNTRSFGHFLFLTTYVLSLASQIKGVPLYYASISCAFLLYGHRMSTQLFFFLALFDLFFGNTLLIQVLLSGLVIVFIFSLGSYYYILKGHLVQIRYWIRQILKNKEHIKPGLREFFLSIVSRNLFIFYAGFLWIFNDQHTILNDQHTILSQIFERTFALVFIVAVLTTFIKVFRCVGEGYRYIGYTNPFVSWFIVLHPVHVHALFFFSLLSLFPAVYRQYQLWSNKANRAHGFAISEETASFLKEKISLIVQEFGECRFMSWPAVIDDYVAYSFENVRVLFHDNGLALDECYQVPFGNMKMTKERLSPWLEKFDLNLIVLLEDLSLMNYEKFFVDGRYYYIKSKEAKLESSAN